MLTVNAVCCLLGLPVVVRSLSTRASLRLKLSLLRPTVLFPGYWQCRETSKQRLLGRRNKQMQTSPTEPTRSQRRVAWNRNRGSQPRSKACSFLLSDGARTAQSHWESLCGVGRVQAEQKTARCCRIVASVCGPLRQRRDQGLREKQEGSLAAASLTAPPFGAVFKYIHSRRLQ